MGTCGRANLLPHNPGSEEEEEDTGIPIIPFMVIPPLVGRPAPTSP
jgi:hypothetical protein